MQAAAPDPAFGAGPVPGVPVLPQTKAGRRGGRERPAVRLLILADGYRYLGQPYGLDFSPGPMGLSRFVTSLLDASTPVRFEIALAHLDQRDAAAMMPADRRIRQRMTAFAFDDPSQFRSSGFDAVFLFGCVEKLSRDDGAGRRRLDAGGAPYPIDRLAETEIAAISAFQRDGGGVFAAGDCGLAGRLLGHDLPRVGRMRRWAGRLPPPGPIPGPDPSETAAQVHAARLSGQEFRAAAADTGPAFDAEFPPSLDGGPRPLPQPVRAGPPGATGLYAYDGHRAGIGRAMTASTWRPFLNGALQEFCGAPAAPEVRTGRSLRVVRRGLEERCAMLAAWLARPDIDRHGPGRRGRPD